MISWLAAGKIGRVGRKRTVNKKKKKKDKVSVSEYVTTKRKRILIIKKPSNAKKNYSYSLILTLTKPCFYKGKTPRILFIYLFTYFRLF